MVWEQHGVLQNKAAMPRQSLLMTQKGASSGIRLKQSWRHSRQALRPGQRSVGWWGEGIPAT
jgi:hypothetical protein